jgi:hypothetical protein
MILPLSTQGFLHPAMAISDKNSWQSFNGLVISIARQMRETSDLSLTSIEAPNETKIPPYRRSSCFHGARCFCPKQCLFFR